jgi:thymidylate kinase
MPGLSQGQRPFISGILLDGHECSGKTSIARLIADGLRARCRAVTLSHGTLTRGGLVDAMLREAVATFDGAQDRPFHDLRLWRRFNGIRSAQLVVDAELAAAQGPSAPGAVHVQDRYWLTQQSFNTFLTPGEVYLAPEWTRTRAPRFAVQVYLTCSAAARRERMAARTGPAKHAVNAFLHRHLEEIVRLDELTTRQVAGDPEWTVLRSDSCTAPELAEQVLGLFEAAEKNAETSTQDTGRVLAHSTNGKASGS